MTSEVLQLATGPLPSRSNSCGTGEDGAVPKERLALSSKRQQNLTGIQERTLLWPEASGEPCPQLGRERW